MKLSKYYQLATLVPAAVLITGGCIWYFISEDTSQTIGPFSITGQDRVFYAVSYVATFSLAACLLALPIFLNEYLAIGEHKISWFGLPVLYMYFRFQASRESYRRIYYDEMNREFILVFNAAFFIGLLWSYSRFRKQMKTVNQP